MHNACREEINKQCKDIGFMLPNIAYVPLYFLGEIFLRLA